MTTIKSKGDHPGGGGCLHHSGLVIEYVLRGNKPNQSTAINPEVRDVSLAGDYGYEKFETFPSATALFYSHASLDLPLSQYTSAEKDIMPKPYTRANAKPQHLKIWQVLKTLAYV